MYNMYVKKEGEEQEERKNIKKVILSLSFDCSKAP